MTSHDGDWWRFWSVASWKTWWQRRQAWREYKTTPWLPGADSARPPRPVSPAWVPATALALLVLAGGEDPAPADPSPPVALASTTTSTRPDLSTTLPTSTTRTSAGVTTTTSVPGTTSPTSSNPLLAAPAAGPSGDPSATPPPGAETMEVIEIIDGDTIRVRTAAGTVESLRLIGMNTPERNECFADEAAQALAALTPVGSRIAATVDVSDRDSNDRLLRYLWVGSLSVNEELVRRGAAIARRYPPDMALAERFEVAQAEAREAQLGLWAPEACGPAADAYLRTVDVAYDAPGDDNANLNEEYITIANEGTNTVDLTGWSVKDESASHRYRFPAGFALTAGETLILRTGCGDDFGTELFWCNVGSAVWNNDGDTVFILDPNGNTHDSYTYSPPSSETPPKTSATTPAAAVAPIAGNCDPSYPDVCIPSPPPDLDCGDIPHRRFKVLPPDPHGFDGNDNDGLGCESG